MIFLQILTYCGTLLGATAVLTFSIIFWWPGMDDRFSAYLRARRVYLDEMERETARLKAEREALRASTLKSFQSENADRAGKYLGGSQIPEFAEFVRASKNISNIRRETNA